MSRSGYTCDLDQWDLIRWRGAVASAIRGKRGQAFLREMLDSLDALPQKRLISGELVHEGEVCAIGSVGVRRGVFMDDIDPYDAERIADAFDIADALAKEIEFVNDDDFAWKNEPPENRFRRVRQWVVENIQP
jgi:hypothetical protein